MKKNILIIILVLFMFPCFVYAKDYDYTTFSNTTDHAAGYAVLDGEEKLIIFKPGDKIHFNDNRNTSIFLDGTNVGSCYGNYSGCLEYYEIEEKVICSGYSLASERAISFMPITDEENYYYYGKNLEEHNLYKPGDIVVFPHSDYQSYYYDEDGTEEGNSFGIAHKLPQHLDTNYLWKLSYIDGGAYAPVAATFEVYPYVAPSICINCDKNMIQYGQKTTCTVSTTSKEQLTEINFDIVGSAKISNVQLSDHVTSTEGERQYNLRIADGYAVNNESFILMRFDLEGTKNEEYIDNISISNINYRDSVFEDTYSNVQTNFEVVPNVFTNPSTYKNLFFVIAPVLSMLIALAVFKYKTKEIDD